MTRNNGLKKKVEAEKPKKEFKIEIVKIGKLEENTGDRHDLIEGGPQNSQNSY